MARSVHRMNAKRPMTDLESPGDHLRAELKRLGIDQVTLSTRVGVSRQTVNNIINGRQEISRPIARKLGVLTGRPNDYWLRSSFAPFKPANARGKSKAKAKPIKTFKKSTLHRNAPSEASFHDFIQKEGTAIVAAFEKHLRRASITSWSDLRRYIKAVDGGEDKLVEARALWQSYKASIKARD